METLDDDHAYPKPEKYVKYLPFGLFFRCLGLFSPYFGGPGIRYSGSRVEGFRTQGSRMYARMQLRFI